MTELVPEIFPGAKILPGAFVPLTKEQERGFRKFYTEYATRSGLNQNPDDPRHAYNYRAWYRAWKILGLDDFAPAIDPEDQKWHGPSLFKAATHPNRFVRTESGLLDSILDQLVLE